jgi:hypothetical protein
MNPNQNQPDMVPPPSTGGQPAGGSAPPQNYQTQPQQTQEQLPDAKSVNPNSTQNSLQIAEIRDGIVIMSDGSYRSVIMAQSINFDLMSPQERESVEFGYQGFLNSLYFPIQIYVHSQKVDMRPYLERLDTLRQQQENMLLAMLMDDYIEYIYALTQQANIMDKKFYVVVPYFSEVDIAKPVEAGRKVLSGFVELFKINKNAATTAITINEQDLLKAKQELKNRVQSVLNGLSQMGVQGAPLDTEELIELYYDVYNPDTATRQTLRSMDELNVPIIEKGQAPTEGSV